MRVLRMAFAFLVLAVAGGVSSFQRVDATYTFGVMLAPMPEIEDRSQEEFRPSARVLYVSVTATEPGSDARGKLADGDAIVEINGSRVRGASVRDFWIAFAMIKFSSRLRLKVERGGREVPVVIEPLS